MPVDSIVISYHDYVLIGVIALSLIAGLISVVVVARQLYTERGFAKKEAVRTAAKP